MLPNWFQKMFAKSNRKRSAVRGDSASIEQLEVRELPAILFVATTGNDSTGSGAINSPYQTLSKAIAITQPGDTVVLRSGTYAGGVRIDNPNVTIKSFENEWAVITAPTNNKNIETVIRFSANASGGKLQRLEIIGGYYYGVKLDGEWSETPRERIAATNVTIEDSKIHDTGRDAIKITPGCDDVVIRRNDIFRSGVRPLAGNESPNAEGIDNVNGDRMIVQDNYIHDTLTNGVYAKGGSIGTVIERNLVTNTGGAGIMFGFQDTDAEWFDTTVNPGYYENIDGIISNNIVMNTVYAGIGLYAARNATVVNNTLIDVAQSGQAALLVASSETYIGNNPPLFVANRDITFANNIVRLSSASTRPAVEIRSGGLTGPLQMAANRYFDLGNAAEFKDRRTGSEFTGGLSAWRLHIGGETGSSEGDPRLDSNLHLLPGSPCIDAGNNSFAAMLDYDGKVRSGVIDIGADEAGAGPARQVPPTGGPGTFPPDNSSTPVQVGFSANSSQGSEALTSPQIVVTLSKASSQPVTVGYALAGATATSGTDFSATTGTVTFLSGQTVANIPLNVVNDILDENDETFTVSLSNPVNASLSSISTHTYTIIDNDNSPTVQYVSSNINWNETVSTGSVAVKLSAPSGRPVTVVYRVLQGTATAGSDYRISEGTLTFQPGQTQQSIPVSIIDDNRDEENETFVLTLLSPTNAILGNQVNSTITIQDNDVAPSVRFVQATSSIVESGRTVSVNVILSVPSEKTVRINYTVSPKTATGSGVDFTASSGTLIFLPGETTKSISITIINDTRTESNETVQLKLSSPINATLGSITTHTLTILDDDFQIRKLRTLTSHLADLSIRKLRTAAR